MNTREHFDLFQGNVLDNQAVGRDGANASLMSGLSPLSPAGLAADLSPLERPRDQTFPASSAPPPLPLQAGVALPPGYSTQLVASIVGVLQGLSSHNLPAQHAHHGHQNIQHMGAACNHPSARHTQHSRPVHPPANHQPRFFLPLSRHQKIC